MLTFDYLVAARYLVIWHNPPTEEPVRAGASRHSMRQIV
jgi:hypothetical protein